MSATDFLKHAYDLSAKGDSYSSLFDFFKNNVRRKLSLYFYYLIIINSY